MNVLLVEDNEEHAELISFALEKFTTKIERACDGEQAVARLLSSSSPPPDLTLLDINMPGMNGLEVLEQVKKARRGRLAPIVMLTTSASPNDRMLAYHFHANGYVVKPADFGELEQLLEAVATFWGKWNRRPDFDLC